MIETRGGSRAARRGTHLRLDSQAQQANLRTAQPAAARRAPPAALTDHQADVLADWGEGENRSFEQTLSYLLQVELLHLSNHDPRRLRGRGCHRRGARERCEPHRGEHPHHHHHPSATSSSSSSSSSSPLCLWVRLGMNHGITIRTYRISYRQSPLVAEYTPRLLSPPLPSCYICTSTSKITGELCNLQDPVRVAAFRSVHSS